MNSTLITKYITENSRMQRRGRVGRVGNGRVHYIYNPAVIQNMKDDYKICISNINESMFLLLKPVNDIAIFTPDNDPNNITIMKQYLGTLQKPLPEILERVYPMSLHKYVYRQYFVNDKYYEYRGSNAIDTHQTLDAIQYQNGVSSDELNDTDGIYYIIHPDELALTRNILGQITHRTLSVSNIESTLKLLTRHFLLLCNDKEYIKTKYGETILSIYTALFSLDERGLQYSIICCFAHAYGCLEQVLKIIVVMRLRLLQKVNCVVKNANSDMTICLNEYNQLTANLRGDSTVYYNGANMGSIMTSIKKWLTPAEKALREYTEIYSRLTTPTLTKQKTQIILLDEVFKYIDKKQLQSHTFKSIDQQIGCAFLHGLSGNLVHMSTIAKSHAYIYMMNPNLNVRLVINSNNSCVPQWKYSIVFYNELRFIEDDYAIISNVSEVDPTILSYISYLFDKTMWEYYMKQENSPVCSLETRQLMYTEIMTAIAKKRDSSAIFAGVNTMSVLDDKSKNADAMNKKIHVNDKTRATGNMLGGNNMHYSRRYRLVYYCK
jgi:hypothetical protein